MDQSLKEATDRVLEQYGSMGHSFWRALTGRDPIVLPHPSDPNLKIEVSSMWDRVKPGGAIRVIVSTFELAPTRFTVMVPTTSFLVFENGRIETFGPVAPQIHAEALARAFEARFSEVPRVFRAPGRVNLIGEHTDYNDGLVMPAAIEFATWVAVTPREDRRLIVHSMNYDESGVFGLDGARHRGNWSDYVVGVARTLERAGIPMRGANLLIRSDVPIGAGLSSSAALEVAVALALLPEPLDPTTVARLCQRAENEFVGVRCGIMDQFVACHARAGNAIMLDCRSLDYSFAPLPDGVKMVIANTMVRHSLAGGEYNKRRAECAEAAAYFGRSLRDVTLQDLERATLPEAIHRRCRHVITENARVLDARAALDRGDLAAFGERMYESHRSLRDDYEVSCAELDMLVEIASGEPGAYGSRMTGGGFGGCTINLVREESVDGFRRAIKAKYLKRTGCRTGSLPVNRPIGAGGDRTTSRLRRPGAPCVSVVPGYGPSPKLTHGAYSTCRKSPKLTHGAELQARLDF